MAIVSILIFFSLGQNAGAGTVAKVKKKTVMIRLGDGEKVKSGDMVSIMDSNGKTVGKVQIRKAKSKSALGKLVKGKAKKGYKTVASKRGKKRGKKDSGDSDSSSESSTVSSKSFQLRVNPLPLVLTGEIGGDIGFKIGDSMAIGIAGSVYSESTTALDVTAESSGLAVGPRVDVYLGGTAYNSGMLLAIMGQYVTASYSFIGVTAEAAGFKAAALIEYQYFLGKNFSVTGGLGVQYGSISNVTLEASGLAASITNPLSGVGVAGELGIGVAF